MLRYLGRHRRMLDAEVKKVTGAEGVRWLDFPFDKKKKQWKDAEWKGLDFLPSDDADRSEDQAVLAG